MGEPDGSVTVLEDRELRCLYCQEHFTFTVQEQELYTEQGWPDPIRCPACRAAKREDRRHGKH